MAGTTKRLPKRTAARLSKAKLDRLRELFRRNGYVRLQDPKLAKAGSQVYKKGDEVRMVAGSRAELAETRSLLKGAGFKIGKPFPKGNQLRQPIYGREQVARLLALMRWKKPR